MAATRSVFSCAPPWTLSMRRSRPQGVRSTAGPSGCRPLLSARAHGPQRLSGEVGTPHRMGCGAVNEAGGTRHTALVHLKGQELLPPSPRLLVPSPRRDPSLWFSHDRPSERGVQLRGPTPGRGRRACPDRGRTLSQTHALAGTPPGPHPDPGAKGATQHRPVRALRHAGKAAGVGGDPALAAPGPSPRTRDTPSLFSFNRGFKCST